jgi:Abnormal spindle-like microcephaly-assoc'd, ASPM-SPD-2-Hydin
MIVTFAALTHGTRIGGRRVAPSNAKMARRSIPAAPAKANLDELRKQALNRAAGMPLYFEVNRGQVDPSVRYLARSGRYSLFLTDDAAVFSLIGGDLHKSRLPDPFVAANNSATNLTESAVRMRLVGANRHPAVEGMDPLPGRVNYLIGEKKNWHRDIPTFGRVRFHDVYPGVDVVYYGTPSALEYDLIAAPGANASKIKFAIEGPATTTQTASGDILIETTSGTIRIAKPQNYQQNADGSRAPVDGSFTLSKDGTVVAGVPTREVGFALASYDRRKTLFIDPVASLALSSFAKPAPLLSYFAESGLSVGPLNLEEASCEAKQITYSSYFGGDGSSVGPLNMNRFSQFLGTASLTGSEAGVDLALDGNVNAYIVGTAYSNNLPSAGFFQSSLMGANSIPSQNPNVFVAEFDTNDIFLKSSLVYATYLGANGDTTIADVGHGNGDIGLGIAADADGDAYVVGQTYSGQAGDSPSQAFPGASSCGAWGQTNIGASANTGQGFVAELAAGGDSLVYSCYIPGANNVTAARVALVPGCASNCDAYVVGSTQSTAAKDGFVVTANAAQSELASGESGLSNAFITVVAGGGTAAAPVYSTYYGGTGNGAEGDDGLGISVESASEVAITGSAFSDNIPLTANAAQSTFLGTTNKTSMAFVAMFDPGGTSSTSLTYGSYLGGSGNKNTSASLAIGDVGTAIVLDGSDVFVSGLTASTNFPVEGVAGVATTNPPYQPHNQPEANVGTPATTGFITELDPSATAGLDQIVYSTYFGGTGFSLDGPVGLGDAIGAMAEYQGIVYVTGLTTSASGAGTFPTSDFACETNNASSGIKIDGGVAPVTAFVAALDTTQSVAADQLNYSTLLGGSAADVGLGLAYDPLGQDIYVVGTTYSTDFPVTANAYQLSNNAFNTPDNFQSTAAFMTEIFPEGVLCPSVPSTATPSPTATATTSATATATRTATATATATVGTPTATATATQATTPTATSSTTATATATASSTPTATATPTGTATPTATATASATATPTATATATQTATRTVTATPTATATPIQQKLTISPGALAFGTKTTVGKSKAKSVTIKNAGKTKTSSVTIEMEGVSGSAFELKSECKQTLAPGKKCKVSVTFSPTDTTAQSGTLTITDNVSGSPQSVPLSGTGRKSK